MWERFGDNIWTNWYSLNSTQFKNFVIKGEGLTVKVHLIDIYKMKVQIVYLLVFLSGLDTILFGLLHNTLLF